MQCLQFLPVKALIKTIFLGLPISEITKSSNEEAIKKLIQREVNCRFNVVFCNLVNQMVQPDQQYFSGAETLCLRKGFLPRQLLFLCIHLRLQIDRNTSVNAIVLKKKKISHPSPAIERGRGWRNTPSTSSLSYSFNLPRSYSCRVLECPFSRASNPPGQPSVEIPISHGSSVSRLN